MDPSVLLRAYKSPQWPDPVEEYKGFLSLRQMMDLGKLRQVQLRQTEIENQQKQQALDDARRLREALAGGIPEDAPLSTYLQRFGEEGVKIYGAVRQAKTAESTLQTAKLTQGSAERKARTEQQQQVADVLYGIRNIQDPGQRQDAMDEATMLDLMRPAAQRLGLGKIGEVTPLAPNEQQFRAQYAAAYTPEKLQTLLTNEASAARTATEGDLKTTQEQGKIAGGTLGFVADQDSLTKWYNELPVFWRSRVGPPPTYNAATMARLNKMFQTAEQRQQAMPNSPDEVIAAINNPQTPREDIPRLTNMLTQMVKYRQDVRPVLGGQDTSALVESVRKNPETYAGLPAETKAAILPALTAQGFKPPPPEDYKKRLIAIRDTRNALAQYRKHLETYDPLMRPGTPKFARMQTAYRSLQLRAKEAANLGALNGPDMQLLNETLGDPTSWMGRYAGADTLTAQADEYGSILDNSESTLRETYGQPAATTPNQPPRATPTAPTPTRTTSQPIPNPIVEVKRGPDGKLR